MPPKRVPTIKKVDLTETLLLVSGMFLFMGAFWNLAELYWGFSAPAIVLGLLSLISSVMAIGMVILPSLMKQVEGEIISAILILLAAILMLWGLIVTFTWELRLRRGDRAHWRPRFAFRRALEDGHTEVSLNHRSTKPFFYCLITCEGMNGHVRNAFLDRSC